MSELMDDLQAPDWDQLTEIQLIGTPALVSQPITESLAGDALLLDTSAGQLLLQINDAGVRLSSVEQRASLYDYQLLTNPPEALPLSVEHKANATMLTSGAIRVDIQHLPFALSFSVGQKTKCHTTTDGHFVRQYRVPPLAKSDAGWWLSLALKSGEPIYGLGEKWGALNKRGQLLRSFNQDALGVNAERSYKNTPFAWSPEGWGLFCHTASPVTHSVGFPAWSQRSYCALIEDPCLDVFFLLTDETETNHGAAIIQRYTQITGRAPIPPRWSNGVILSKAYYRTADEILDAARTVREKGMPCDVITFDGRAWQNTDTRFAFEWDASRYPDPARVIDELKDMGFKICIWEYPLISIKHKWFDEFAKKGWLLRDQQTGEAAHFEWDRGPFGDVLTPLPTSGIVDFTHPDAYEFWCAAHKPLFDLGVDMIKADFGEQVADSMLAHNGETGRALHNVYAHLYNRCVFEAAERYSRSGSFLFSRAAWIGSQRFNSHWGGDPQADWEGMISNIRGGLSWGLSGSPFYATDVGGFYKDTRDNALYVRWAQAAIFSAHFRLHGIGAREPWTYSPAAEQAVMEALRLRYALLAYLENAQLQAHNTGLPVQRPMVLAFPHEPAAWAFENQFMFGDDLLVAPCFDANGTVNFYLPEGDWVHFQPNTDGVSKGASDAALCATLTGRQMVSLKLKLDQIAVFARADAKIPLCKPMEFTDQHGTQFEMDSVWTNTAR